jgi:hypothetical protein
MRSIKYIVILILVILISSVLLNNKIYKWKNAEKFNPILSDDKRQKNELDSLKNKNKGLKKNIYDEEIAQKIGFTSLLEYITGENERREKNRKSIIKNMKKNNPLNKFVKNNNLKCQDIQIDIPDSISSNNGKESLILKSCAKACHNNKNCLSFDYKDKKCRLSTWCSKGTAENQEKSILYRDKTKPTPDISKFNIHPNKKMFGSCTNSRIGGYESKSSLLKCAKKCSKTNDCLSFDLTGRNKDICKIYKKCHNMHMTNNKDSFSGVLANSSTYSFNNRKNTIKRSRPN